MTCLTNYYKSVLVVDDNEIRRSLLVYYAYSYNIIHVETACTMQEAISKIDCRLDLVLTVSYLSKKICIPIIKYCRNVSPKPKLVVMIENEHSNDIIALIQEGIDTYIELPLDNNRFRNCLDSLQTNSSYFENICRAQVGRLNLIEAQRLLRKEMFREALKQSYGNRSKTAQLLGVSRRYVQSMIHIF